MHCVQNTNGKDQGVENNEHFLVLEFLAKETRFALPNDYYTEKEKKKSKRETSISRVGSMDHCQHVLSIPLEYLHAINHSLPRGT